MDKQIGLEESPDAHVEALVGVFREVWRVLRNDGTLWLNYGDSYANTNPGSGGKCVLPGAGRAMTEARYHSNKRSFSGTDLKPKDLIGLPWMVAFALRADGWYLRSAITLCKNNPMPESVTDRPTQATEMLFLLTKAPRYYYDADAIREPQPSADPAHPAYRPIVMMENGCTQRGEKGLLGEKQVGVNRGPKRKFLDPRGRNKRNWWVLNSQPLPDQHFASFPEKLVEPCILAGTSEWGCCAGCGAPWKRVVENPRIPDEIRNRDNGAKMDFHSRQTGGGQKLQEWRDANPPRTTGWVKTCSCDTDETVPATVMDIFGGSGTVGKVATKLGRRSILIELNPEYVEISNRRNAQLGLGV